MSTPQIFGLYLEIFSRKLDEDLSLVLGCFHFQHCFFCYTMYSQTLVMFPILPSRGCLLLKAQHRDFPHTSKGRMGAAIHGWAVGYHDQGGTILIVDVINIYIYYNSFSADGSEDFCFNKICIKSNFFFLTEGNSVLRKESHPYSSIF